MMPMRSDSQFAPPERRLPIILGGGLTGLAISRQLSAARIEHVLVCAPPGDKPRLGESLNAEGSLEAARQFPDYGRFFHDKQRVALFFGDDAVSFDAIRSDAAPAWYAASGYPGDVRLVHVERVGFDQALYDAVVADACCRRLDDRAVAVDVRPGTERIHQVRLASGRVLAASYVFDATNHLRVVPRSLGLAQRVIGEPRRVVFAHYARDARPAPGAAPPWLRATLLLRLQSRRDGVDGLAWCIPLGDYVSIGIGVDPATTSANAELLLQWTERAYAARGIAVRDAFAARGAPVDLRYQHYDHDRCHGANWLLAGPTCCQVWFPSAAGVGSGLLAARLAPDLLHAPRRAGAIYQDYMDDVSRSHGRLDWLAHAAPDALSPADVRRHAATMARGNVRRLASYVGLERTPAELNFGNALLRLFESARGTATPLETQHVAPSAQASQVFAQARDVDPWMDPLVRLQLPTQSAPLNGPAAVLAISQSLSRLEPVDTESHFLGADFQLEIDDMVSNGTAAWSLWITLLREARQTPPSWLPLSLEADDGDWVLGGRWISTDAQGPVVSMPVRIHLSLHGEVIHRVRLSRVEHACVLGESLMPRAALIVALARLTAKPPSERLEAAAR